MGILRLASFACLLPVLACAPARQAHGPPSPVPPAPDLEIGAVVHLSPGAPLGALRRMGGRWARVDLIWGAVEPEPGCWDFSVTDRAVDEALAQDLHVYGSLLYAPAWATRSGRPGGVPPERLWREFVRLTAARYRGKVEVFGVWNEPNLEEFWEGSVADYVEVLLKPAFQEVRREAPGARVAGPELAHLYSARLQPQLFLEELVRRGGADCLDLVSHHVYGHGDFEEKVLGFRFHGFLYRPGLEQMLETSGLWGKEVWITEMGVNALERGEADQAAELVRQLSFLRTLPWVRKAFLYELADDPGHAEQWGMLRSDHTPRPAYAAMLGMFGIPRD